MQQPVPAVYFNEKKQQFFPLPFNTPDSLKTIEHKIIYRDSHHNWWIGFYGKGLYRFNDIERKSNFYSLFRPSSSPEYLEMLYPTAISEDQQGNLWMGRAAVQLRSPNGTGERKNLQLCL